MLRDDAGTEDILLQLRQEKERAGSFFELVPDHLKGHVQSLAHANQEYYKDLFPDFHDFLEKMAENWLAKTRSFDVLAKASGMEDLGWNPERKITDKSFVVALTSSASYVMAGKGAFGAEGGPVAYVRIPFRRGEHGEKRSWIDWLLHRNVDQQEEVLTQEQVVFDEKPRKGDKWHIPGSLYTSPLLSIYGSLDRGSDDSYSTQTLHGLHDTVTGTFRRIDDETFHG